jgi:hypothetical protein
MDTLRLSKTGFTLIRDLLQGRIEGGVKAAEQLADALHNLPDPGDDFLNRMTIERLQAFAHNHPQIAHIIGEYVDLTES